MHRHAPDWLILSIACIAQFMVVLDVSIVNVALPKMGHDLHFSILQRAVGHERLRLDLRRLPPARRARGRLLRSTSRVLAGLVVFTLASMGAGFAATGSQMMAVRAIQGLGGAILSPATLTIIVTTFHGSRLPKAIGAWSAVAGAGGAVGALLGGILTGLVSWRWMFFINIPIGVVAGVVALLYLREMRNKDATAKLDVTGAVLVTGGLASVIYAVVNTTTHAWTSSTTIDWLLGGAVLLVAFLFWEAKVASHPSMPFRIFRSRSLSTANGVMMLVGGVFFAMWYFLTFYFQYVLGYGPVKTGFAFFPMAVGIIVGAQLSSRLIARAGVRPSSSSGLRSPLGFLLDLLHPAPQWLRRGHPRALRRLRLRDGSPLRAARHRRDLRGRPGGRRSRLGRLEHRPPGRRLAGARHPGHRRRRRHGVPGRLT